MSDSKETWAPVNHPLYCNAYEVSTLGRVRSLPRIAESDYFIRRIHGGLLKGRIRSDGFKTVILSNKNIRTKFYIRDLVADAFIPNPDKLPTIILKNGNPLDCSVGNLKRANNENGEALVSLTSRGKPAC